MHDSTDTLEKVRSCLKEAFQRAGVPFEVSSTSHLMRDLLFEGGGVFILVRPSKWEIRVIPDSRFSPSCVPHGIKALKMTKFHSPSWGNSYPPEFFDKVVARVKVITAAYPHLVKAVEARNAAWKDGDAEEKRLQEEVKEELKDYPVLHATVTKSRMGSYKISMNSYGLDLDRIKRILSILKEVESP